MDSPHIAACAVVDVLNFVHAVTVEALVVARQQRTAANDIRFKARLVLNVVAACCTRPALEICWLVPCWEASDVEWLRAACCNLSTTRGVSACPPIVCLRSTSWHGQQGEQHGR